MHAAAGCSGCRRWAPWPLTESALRVTLCELSSSCPARRTRRFCGLCLSDSSPACLRWGVSPLGTRACRWVPFGVGGPGAGCPSPLPLGCVPGPRGKATARLYFSTSPGWINSSAAWVSPWFSPCWEAWRSCLQLSVRWSVVSLFFFNFFLRVTWLGIAQRSRGARRQYKKEGDWYVRPCRIRDSSSAHASESGAAIWSGAAGTPLCPCSGDQPSLGRSHQQSGCSSYPDLPPKEPKLTK